MVDDLPERFTNPHTKHIPHKGRNILPPEVLAHPKYRSFFEVINVIADEMIKQHSRDTKVLTLPKSLDMEAISNYGITAQFWFDHNFGDEYGIIIERR